MKTDSLQTAHVNSASMWFNLMTGNGTCDLKKPRYKVLILIPKNRVTAHGAQVITFRTMSTITAHNTAQLLCWLEEE